MKRLNIRMGSNLRSGVVLSATLVSVCMGSVLLGEKMTSSPDEFDVAAFLPPDRVAIYRAGLEETPRVIHAGFTLAWVSRDGVWVGGQKLRTVFDREPICLYVQNIKTEERRNYCGVGSVISSFAFTDDFRYVAVLGRALDQGNPMGPTGLFLIDLSDVAREPLYVMRGLDRDDVSGISFTHDGRQLAFARGDELFSYDMRDRALKKIGNGTEPIMAPSGAQLCYVDSDRRLVVQDMQTGRRVLIGAVGSEAAQWSPDGRRILFRRPTAGEDGSNYELISLTPAAQGEKVLGRMYSLGGVYWWVTR